MRRKLFSGFLVISLLISMLGLTFNIHSVRAGTIIVPDDHPTIQAAIDASSIGDTIIVRSGIYIENVKVRKDHLTIESENGAEVTIVQAANSSDHVFEITANYIEISGFTVEGVNQPRCAGIRLIADSCRISNCGIFENTIGVSLYSVFRSCKNNLITNNKLSDNGVGITIEDTSPSNSRNNTIQNNKFSNNGMGVMFSSSENNTIKDNEFLDNAHNDIYLYHTEYDMLAGNTFTNGGLSVMYSHNNTVVGNLVNDKPLIYLEGASDREIDNAGQVVLVNCNKITVKDLNLSNTCVGVELSNTDNSEIRNNTLSNNRAGIWVENSTNNAVVGNKIFGNLNHGVYLFASDENMIVNNDLQDNLMGISGGAVGSDVPNGNIVYLNNLINNTWNLHPNFHNNPWNNLWSSAEKITYAYRGKSYSNYLGNFWSDYYGSDSDEDGIGDTPYGHLLAKDNYPLMNPFENYGVTVSPDFSVTASPASLTIQQGSSGKSQVIVTSKKGFDLPVQLSVSGMPPGVTATLDPTTVTPLPDGSISSTLTITADTPTPLGGYILTVTGNGGAMIHDTYLSLEISAKFMIGDRVRTTANLNVTEGPGLSYEIAGNVPEGTLGQIIDGPVEADGYVWWYVSYNIGIEGWSAEDWLEKAANLTPDEPEDLAQLVDGTGLGTGATTSQRSIEFKARLSDPDGDMVRLQVELRNLDEHSGNFNEEAEGFKNSDFVMSGTVATAYAHDLNDEKYHWRARTVDEHGTNSEWVDFGNNDLYWTDFAVDTTPPETYILSGPEEGAILSDNDVIFKVDGWDQITSYLDLLYSYRLQGYDPPEAWSDWKYSDVWGWKYTDLPDGDYTFIVKAKDEAGYVDPTPAERTFAVSVTGPHIDKIDPPSGAPGILVKIIGRNLERQWGGWVNFGGDTTSVPESWSDNEIIMRVPGGKGVVEVKVELDLRYESNAITFTYNNPHIDAITPQSGQADEPVTISGADFGEGGAGTLGTGFYVKFGESLAVTPRWTDKEIVATPPSDFGTGENDKERLMFLLKLAYYGWGDLVDDATRAVYERLLQELLDKGIRISVAERKIEVDVKVITPTGEPSNSIAFTYIINDVALATLLSPGELRVYDSQGRVTGLVNGQVKEEIPYSYCVGNSILVVYSSNSCCFEIAGNEEGTYGLDVNFGKDGSTTSFFAHNIPVSQGEVHTYVIDWGVLSFGGEGVSVRVDSDGVFEYTFTSDSELTREEFLSQTATAAAIDFGPHVLNLKSKGKWITGYIELPEGYDPANINVSTVMLNGTFSAELTPTAVGDHDNNSVSDLMIEFNRTAVTEFMLSEGLMTGNVTLTVTGNLMDGDLFQGSVVITVRMPGDVNVDGKVDGKDIAFAAMAFGTCPRDPRWNCVADENEDNKADGKDIVLIALNFGKAYP